jgi:hypothetical protein
MVKVALLPQPSETVRQLLELARMQLPRKIKSQNIPAGARHESQIHQPAHFK